MGDYAMQEIKAEAEDSCADVAEKCYAAPVAR